MDRRTVLGLPALGLVGLTLAACGQDGTMSTSMAPADGKFCVRRPPGAVR